MLTGVYVMVVGGDERQLEVIDKLIEWDANVKICGFELENVRTSGVRQVLMNEEECSSADVIVFPMTGIHADGLVDAEYADGEIRVNQKHISALPSHAKLFCGFACESLIQMCQIAGIECVELLRRDDVAILNSIPTAEGAVALAMEHTDITIHGSNAMVLGFGRVGMTLAGLLKSMGANVSVGVQFPAQYARAFEMNLNPFYTAEWDCELSAQHLLFNTIPSMIITAKVIAGLNPSCVIIDLATKPGGTDFRFAEKRHLKAIQAPSLPGIVAPKTAGNMIATTLSRLITADLRGRKI